MKRLSILLALLTVASAMPQQADRAAGQGRGRGRGAPAEAPTPPDRKTKAEDGPNWNLLANLIPRSIGPTTVGGRIMNICVYEKEPRIYFVATASGGLWKTENAGITFKPIFDREGSISLGAVAVNPNDPNIIWVGTGEQSSRNSVAWGDGVYKSTDGGKTWKNMGLVETRHISKIVLDPKNPDIAYVGALGRLWGDNPERGVYMTTDGGKTWEQTLKVDEKTGCIDLAMDPKNPRVMLAAMWQRRRYPYDFVSGGPGSGLFKSNDSGRTWKKITQGVPAGPLGRIGISFYRNDPHIVTATIEYKPGAEEKRPRDGGQTARRGGGTFRSTDGGETWTMVNTLNPRPFYFSMPVQDPVDEKRIYIPSDQIDYTDDSGKTFKVMQTSIHPDFHAWWIDPKDNNHMIVGNDGGVYTTFDRGGAWMHNNSLPIGQFYAVAVDMRKPYWIYGGLQDNGSWGVPTQTQHGGVAFFDSVGVGGGDGFHAQVDPTDWATVYTESQGGAFGRYDLRGNPTGRVTVPRGAGNRFNWSTPFIISPHNPRTLYLGGHKLFKSVDRGAHWKAISPDLTTDDKSKQKAGQLSVTPENTGAEMHCTIITISESPTKEGLIYVGTDDGLVHVTQDGGVTWTNLTRNIPGLPRNTWCSRVLASKWEENRVYATFDGHRSNDFKPYVFVSEDLGKTWKSLASGLPDYDNVYVIREGEKNSNLLYLGSEMSLRVSLDLGATWTRFRTEFPTVAVHDLLVHPRDLDLVIGTHGRSLWTLDVTGLEALDVDAMKISDVILAKPQNILLLGRQPNQAWNGDFVSQVRNSQPGTRIQYWLKAAAKTVSLKVLTPAGEEISELDATSVAGLNVIPWASGRVAAGDYRVVLTVDGKTYTTSVKVEPATAE